jgi:hypothetical protein
MKWSKMALIFLLISAGASCDNGPPRIVNSSATIGTNQSSLNSPVNVYNGYPGPDRPKNANVNTDLSRNKNPKTAFTKSKSTPPRVVTVNVQ